MFAGHDMKGFSPGSRRAKLLYLRAIRLVQTGPQLWSAGACSRLSADRACPGVLPKHRSRETLISR